MKIFTGIALLFLAATLPGRELLFNSRFQLGSDGFAATRFLRPDTNPKLIFDPLKTGKVDGITALRVDNRFCERIELNAAELPLAPATAYKLTVALKSSVPLRVNVSVVGTHPVHRWDSTFRRADVTDQFKTFTFNFRTKPKPIGFYTPQIIFESNRPVTLWIGEWSIRKAGDTTSDTVQVSAAAEKSCYVQSQSDQRVVPVKVSAFNPTPETVKFQLKLHAEESSGGNWPDRKYTPVSSVDGGSWEIPAGGTFSKTLNLPTPRYASYRPRVEVSGTPAAGYGTPFAVLGPYTVRKLDLNRDFCVGINGSAGLGFPPYYRFKQPSVMALGMSPDEMMSVYAAEGVRIFRTWGFPMSFSWFSMEPEPGKFNTAAMDLILDLPLRHGIYTIPVVGCSDFGSSNNFKRKYFWGLPDWLLPKCRKELAWRQKDFSKTALFKPAEADWKHFVSEMVRHAGNRVTHYEIMNEPHLIFPKPADYVPYLKWAYQATKEVNPEATVIGFCATSDLGARMEAFYEPCFKAGGLDYADAVSFHPYQNPKLGSLQPADETVRRIHAMVGRFSRKKYPLWNTELYYLRGDTGNETIKGYSSACDLTQRMLTDLGEGLVQSISLNNQQLLESASPHFMSSDGIVGRMTPNSFGVTCNMFARYLESAKPVGKLRWANDSICYLYQRRDGSFAAAFWHYGTMSGLKVDLQCSPAAGELLDLFGNPMKFDKGVPLDENPKVLLWKGSLAALKAKMQHVKISAACPVAAAPEARLLPGASGKLQLTVNFRNLTGETVNGFAGTAAADWSVPLELVPFSEKSVLIPLVRSVSGKTTIRFLAAGRLAEFPVKVVPPGKITRCGVSNQAVAGKGKTVNSWKVDRQNGNLEFLIQVGDATPSGEANGRKWWEQDCVELFFDAMPEQLFPTHSSDYNRNVFRLYLLPRESGKCQIVGQPANCPAAKAAQVVCRRDANGYEIRLTVPEKAIFGSVPPKGKLLGFELKIDDAAGAGPVQAEKLWNGGKTPFCDRYQFGLIIL